jgi:hypothetical protein
MLQPAAFELAGTNTHTLKPASPSLNHESQFTVRESPVTGTQLINGPSQVLIGFRGLKPLIFMFLNVAAEKAAEKAE